MDHTIFKTRELLSTPSFFQVYDSTEATNGVRSEKWAQMWICADPARLPYLASSAASLFVQNYYKEWLTSWRPLPYAR
jgi:hypothetical protein